MAGKIRVAVTGSGYFSRFQYEAWQRIPEIELVAVANRTRSKAAGAAETYRIPAVFDDVAIMLAATRPDLLDIVTPPETHLAAIAAAAEHGVDVICQKPFCQTLRDAEQAVAMADAAGIEIIVHENIRFQPWHREIKRRLDGGLLGRVFQATFRLRPGDGQGARAYLDRQPSFQKMERFLVRETGIHYIDLFRHLFGDVTSVYADLRRLNAAIAGEDAGMLVLELGDGVRAVLDGNRLSDHKAVNRRLTFGDFMVEGEKGTLRLDGDASLSFRAHGSNVEELLEYSWENRGFAGDCVYLFQRHVVDHRLGLGMVFNTGRDYLKNIAIEEAAYVSHFEGRRIAI